MRKKILGEGKYYVIDLTNIKNISLNFGWDTNDLDKYIINNKTHKVYYLKGIQLDEKIYYAKDVREDV